MSSWRWGYGPVFSYGIKEGVVWVTDDSAPGDAAPSVTNEAAYVVDTVVRLIGFAPAFMIYRDCTGVWDYLDVTKKGSFLSFSPLRTKSMKEAIIHAEAREDARNSGGGFPTPPGAMGRATQVDL